jgi:KDO2-lipid IV(A) lauroyltransferase
MESQAMAKTRNRATDFAVYLVVRMVVCVIQAVPPAVAFWLADCIAWLLYRCVPSRRRIAIENLIAAFPELANNPGRTERLVHAMYQHFVRAVFEGLLLPRKLHVTNWRAFIDLYAAHGLPNVLFSERPALIVTAHFGNWEVGGYLFGRIGFRTYAIARELDNEYLERFVLRLRQATGQKILFKIKDFARIQAALRTGGKVATLADQDAGPKGAFVDFFGRPASTHKAIALMALEFGATIIVIGMPRVSRAGYATSSPPAGMERTFYTVEAEDVIDPREYAHRPDAVQAITARYTSALERLIRRHPEQYFWIHRRWKHQPKAKVKAKAAA